MLPETVAALRSLRSADAAPFQLVFPYGLPNYRTIRRDLVRAGIQVISESGERVDFHALRATFHMYLHKRKVPIETTILLMRHSDPRLAMREYLDVSQLVLNYTLRSLPSIVVLAGQQAC